MSVFKFKKIILLCFTEEKNTKSVTFNRTEG